MLKFELEFLDILLCASFLVEQIGIGLCLYFVEFNFIGLNLYLLCYLQSRIGFLLIFFDCVFMFGQFLLHLLHFYVHRDNLFFFEDQFLKNFFIFFLELLN